MLKRHSDGQELGELVSITRNTYVNPGSVAEFDFQSVEKSGLANKKGAATSISTFFVTTVGAGVPLPYGSDQVPR